MAVRTDVYHANSAFWSASFFRELLRKGLEDDGWPWDWTSLGLPASRNEVVRGKIVAKAEGVWAGNGLVAATSSLARELGAEGPVVRAALEDGARLRPGLVACEWQGPARLVLALERPFLNLAQYASGIATATRRIVDRVAQACPERTPRVVPTRKILPHYRDVAIYGVLAGGGHSHRVNLAGGVLIKENHIAAAGGIAPAIAGARAMAPHGLRIEIEVTSLAELEQAIAARADVVLLDNFAPAEVARALALVEKAGERRPLVEVSGGLTEDNVAAYAKPGVDVLSFGALTHSVRAIDLSLLLDKA